MSGQASRLVKLAVYALIAANAIALLWFWLGAPWLAAQAEAKIGQGDYELAGTDGSNFTSDTLSGTPSAVFFGFTHCPEVCPTTMGDIATWKEELGDAAKDLRVFFVTVDPERDTAEVLDDYVSWVPDVTGVTGSPEQIDAAIHAFGVVARKVPLEGDDYTMDHSASVRLFDGSGRYVGSIAYQEDPAEAMRKLRELVAAG